MKRVECTFRHEPPPSYPFFVNACNLFNNNFFLLFDLNGPLSSRHRSWWHNRPLLALVWWRWSGVGDAVCRRGVMVDQVRSVAGASSGLGCACADPGAAAGGDRTGRGRGRGARGAAPSVSTREYGAARAPSAGLLARVLRVT